MYCLLTTLGYNSGWIDSISSATPSTSTTNNVTLSVEKGGTVVLECNPLSNDPSVIDGTFFVEWKRNNQTISSDRDLTVVQDGGNYLVVRNFSVPDGDDSVTFECSGLAHSERITRTFVLRTVKG